MTGLLQGDREIVNMKVKVTSMLLLQTIIMKTNRTMTIKIKKYIKSKIGSIN
jgi:hypothetical protein